MSTITAPKDHTSWLVEQEHTSVSLSLVSGLQYLLGMSDDFQDNPKLKLTMINRVRFFKQKNSSGGMNNSVPAVLH